MQSVVPDCAMGGQVNATKTEIVHMELFERVPWNKQTNRSRAVLKKR
jgi:hypothetical protein